MSKEGQIFRGELYHEKRDQDGKYPKEYLDNPDIMKDINVYLDSIKTNSKEDKPKDKK